MNKTENISIGRRGYVCDIDAYRVLADYLGRAQTALRDDPDKEEILSDLEVAMAEHLSDLNGNLVVDKKTAKVVIAKMGEVRTVELPSRESDEVQPHPSVFSERLKTFFREPLYKDHTRKIIDGVCAGLARSLGVDPLWIRLVFVVLVFATQGFWVTIYLLLSILMKDKKTQKNKTAGQVIGSIRSSLEESTQLKGYERLLKRVVIGLAKVIWSVLRVFVCAVLVVVAAAWASVLFFMVANPAGVDVFGGTIGWLEYLLVISAGLLLLIPLFELLSAMIRPRRFNSRLSLSLWSIWALSLIVAVSSFANVFPKVKTYIIEQKPKNHFLYTEVHGTTITEWCFSPLGTCENSMTSVRDDQLCGVDTQIYDLEDQQEWLMRGWQPGFKQLPSPVGQDTYCAAVRNLARQDGSLMFADEPVNDPTYTRSDIPDPADGVMKPMWTLMYLEKDY